MKKSYRRAIKVIISALLLIWIIRGNSTIGVTHYTVVNDRIPAAFTGYKIAVISDLHNACFGKENRRLIATIEEEDPDLIAITGDLIDSGKPKVEVAESLVRQLAGTAPIYFVTGNHESWVPETYQELEAKLKDAGVTILHNSVVEIEKNGETIQIAGLDDSDYIGRASISKESADTSGKSYIPGNKPQAKLKEMNLSEDFCILLAHRPEDFGAYASENVDLVLSGHAHGGQVRLPFVGGVVAPGQGFFPKYDAGEYTENNTTMIVSRGIGNSVIPVRINNRPEVVMIHLK